MKPFFFLTFLVLGACVGVHQAHKHTTKPNLATINPAVREPFVQVSRTPDHQLLIVIPPKRKVKVLWNYAGNSNIVFNVFSSKDLATWTFKTNVTSTQVVFSAEQQCEFYKVNASNTLTHEVSGFATR